MPATAGVHDPSVIMKPEVTSPRWRLFHARRSGDHGRELRGTDLPAEGTAIVHHAAQRDEPACAYGCQIDGKGRPVSTATNYALRSGITSLPERRPNTIRTFSRQAIG